MKRSLIVYARDVPPHPHGQRYALMATAPLVFISYSHDSPDHKAWVEKLATDLRSNGVDAILDKWKLSPGQDVAAFMHVGISKSERVLLVCSKEYVAKSDAGSGGVGYEKLVVTAALVENIDTKKFIPIVRANPSSPKTPAWLGPRLYIDFSVDAEYSTKLEELLRELLGVPSSEEPPLGKSPFSGSLPTSKLALRHAGPTGVTQAGEALLEDQWFKTQAEIALKGSGKMDITGNMELRFALHEGLGKSQVELLDAVRRSEIHTFGWPIAVTLENRDEFRPRPFEDGIRAEINIDRGLTDGRKSYDYWAVRSNGDFYLLQSLFEDQRTNKKIFFNTRIVRVTEALLFAANMYDALGVAPETKVSLRVTHRGLAGRELTSSNQNRLIIPGVAREDVSQTQLVDSVGTLRPGIVDSVRRITAPLFMLFDFKQFNDDIYKDIVEKFVKGEVT